MKNKHLTQDERFAIQQGLNHGLSFKKIGANLGKDCTTIAKEVKHHRVFDRNGGYYVSFNDCANRLGCKKADLCLNCTNPRHIHHCSICRNCSKVCSDYKQEKCQRILKAPYVCNGCKDKNRCSLEKSIYSAVSSQKEYEEVRSESRSGINLTEEELKSLDKTLSPLLKNGQSIHSICTNNKDLLNCCEKTLYAYVDASLLSARNIDMPRKIRFKARKKSVEMKVDKSCRIGRTFEDYQNFLKEHEVGYIAQIDSVEGVKGESVLLTIHFPNDCMQLAFLRESNNSQSVIDIFNNLYEKLGKEDFEKLFPVILADNGTEFSNPSAIEFDKDGNRRTYVFYCNPSSPYEKGACENNHEFIRRVVPKGVSFNKYTKEDIELMMNHINSYPRKKLSDKTPYECFEFRFGKEILDKLNIKQIEAKSVILKPLLLKK